MVETGDGGAVGDTFSYTTVTDSTIGSLDSITDFLAGTDKIDTNAIGLLTVVGNQAIGSTLASLTLSSLNGFIQNSVGSLGTFLTGDSTNSQVMQLTTSDNRVIWAIDVDASGVIGASDTVIDVTGLSGTIVATDFI